MTCDENLEKHSKEVFKYMEDNNILKTPSNFSYYFEFLLNDKDNYIKKELSNYTNINIEEENSILELNRTIKNGFLNIRKLNAISKNIFENNNKITTVIKTETNNNKIINVLEKFSTILIAQNMEIKKIEKTTRDILVSIKKQNIYNEEFNVYNLSHFKKIIKKEIEQMNLNNYKSSFLFLRVKKEILKQKSEKEKKIINKMIAKIIKKTARNSDYISYIGSDIFCMLLTQTNLKSAKQAKRRIKNIITETTLFIEEEEIFLDVNIKERFITENTKFDEILITIEDELE